MTPAVLTLILAWRDPARNVAFVFGVFTTLIFVFMAPQATEYWVVLLVAPSFLISTALTVPTFFAV